MPKPRNGSGLTGLSYWVRPGSVRAEVVGYPLALIINDAPDTNLITLEKITITNMGTGEFSRTGDIVQLRLLGTKPVPKDSKIHDQAIRGMESSLWASDEQLDRVRYWEATGHNRPNLPIVTIEADPNRPKVNSDGELQGYMWGTIDNNSTNYFYSSVAIADGYSYFYMDPDEKPLKYAQLLYNTEEKTAKDHSLIFAADMLQFRDGKSRH